MFSLSTLVSFLTALFILRNRGGVARHLVALFVPIVLQGIFVIALAAYLRGPDGWAIQQAAPYLLAGSFLVVVGSIFGMIIAAAWRYRRSF